MFYTYLSFVGAALIVATRVKLNPATRDRRAQSVPSFMGETNSLGLSSTRFGEAVVEIHYPASKRNCLKASDFYTVCRHGRLHSAAQTADAGGRRGPCAAARRGGRGHDGVVGQEESEAVEEVG